MKKDPQHDAHCHAFDQSMWKDWPPAQDEIDLEVHANRPVNPDELSYVIAKSDSVENLYWQDDIQSWGPLTSATYFGRDDVSVIKEVEDGFWMDAARAEELEP